MKKEINYSKTTDSEHIKAFGQYFTPHAVAHFMCKWACTNAKSMLDPAVGNSVFLSTAKKINPNCTLKGYELDPQILSYFGNPAKAELVNADYLLNDWENKYDAIVCNPPYNRFQAIANREELLATIRQHTGISYSAYTNLYILFLIKSIYQLSSNGKLAYIIPSEFLNSKYGTSIKDLLIKEQLLKAVINFQNNEELFFNATTTCCILLLDRTPKKEILFYNLASINELEHLDLEHTSSALSVSYSEITADQKWRIYLNQERITSYRNLTEISKFCNIMRGIATGANDFFCMSKSKMEKLNIPPEALNACICRSADVKKAIFTSTDYTNLVTADKNVYLLNVSAPTTSSLKHYILDGEAKGLHKKYLLSKRTPWYSMEQKEVAPIWVSSACRKQIKFVRNLAGVNSLTTFHSVFIKPEYTDLTDILFCYFLTPIAQNLIKENRKELGNGLDKFQPNDLKTAKMLDLSLLTNEDISAIKLLYETMKGNDSTVPFDQLNTIFSKYLITD